MFGIKHSKTNRLQKNIECKTNEHTKQSNTVHSTRIETCIYR